MKGVYTALVTPFDRGGELDLESYRKILRDQIAAGVAGVVPCGTTGETPTLTIEEKKTLIETAIKELRGSGLRVIAGTGSNNTAESVKLSKWASEAGADAVLLITPYYNKPMQAGMVEHFRAIADAVSCEAVLYNVPARTGVSLTAETITTLAAHPRIRTIKEATGNTAFASEVLDSLRLARRSMDVLSGDDATYLPLLSVGAVGVISVASNLFPRAVVALQKASESGRYEEARKLHERFYPLFRDLFLESNPSPVKFALEQQGFCGVTVRAPLVQVTEATMAKLRESLSRCGLKKGTPA